MQYCKWFFHLTSLKVTDILWSLVAMLLAATSCMHAPLHVMEFIFLPECTRMITAKTVDVMKLAEMLPTCFFVL